MRQNELRRVPSLFDTDFYEGLMLHPLWGGCQLQRSHVMRCDLKETDDTYEVKADLPGVDKEDITVDFNDDDNILTISYEHKGESEDKGEDGGYVIRERTYSKMSRRFALPAGNRDDIHAKYDNGVLMVTVGKDDEQAKKAKPTITIE